MSKAQSGITQQNGYQIGVRRTVNLPLKEVWQFLFSAHGLAIWLGEARLDKWETGIAFQTAEGITGEIRVFRVFSHIRLTWKPEHWEKASLLQIRTIAKGEKTVISFHQENLKSSVERTQMKERWADALEEIICSLEARENMC